MGGFQSMYITRENTDESDKQGRLTSSVAASQESSDTEPFPDFDQDVADELPTFSRSQLQTSRRLRTYSDAVMLQPKCCATLGEDGSHSILTQSVLRRVSLTEPNMVAGFEAAANGRPSKYCPRLEAEPAREKDTSIVQSVRYLELLNNTFGFGEWIPTAIRAPTGPRAKVTHAWPRELLVEESSPRRMVLERVQRNLHDFDDDLLKFLCDSEPGASITRLVYELIQSAIEWGEVIQEANGASMEPEVRGMCFGEFLWEESCLQNKVLRQVQCGLGWIDDGVFQFLCEEKIGVAAINFARRLSGFALDEREWRKERGQEWM